MQSSSFPFQLALCSSNKTTKLEKREPPPSLQVYTGSSWTGFKGVESREKREQADMRKKTACSSYYNRLWYYCYSFMQASNCQASAELNWKADFTLFSLTVFHPFILSIRLLFIYNLYKIWMKLCILIDVLHEDGWTVVKKEVKSSWIFGFSSTVPASQTWGLFVHRRCKSQIAFAML